ncbi:MAG: hypothetical protein PHF38_07020 [Bacteroidales bacterium]|nr:hypothetical protein [Bacteroidales bacterium]MDD4362096.1 hypothetical protein [Bacteroidales bacterium]
MILIISNDEKKAIMSYTLPVVEKVLICSNMVHHGKIIEQTIWGEKANSTQYPYIATYNLRKKPQYDPALCIDIFRNGDIVLNNTSASRIA